MAYEQIIAKWREESRLLEKKALQLDVQRDCFCSKHYSDMTNDERKKFDELRDAAQHLYIERNCLNRCAAELENERDFQEKKRWSNISNGDLI
jgi:hypothetical protein